MSGLFGVVTKNPCVTDLFYGTDYHSHLGTRRAGISTNDNGVMHLNIHNIQNSYFRTKFSEDLHEMTGNMGIGVISDTDPQPIVVNSHLGRFAVCTVSKINNMDELERECLNQRQQFTELSMGGTNPTELVALLITQGKDFADGIRNVYRHIKGSVSMLILTDKGIIAARDYLGRTPLVIGRRGADYAVASESHSYINIGFQTVRYVGPGEAVLISPDGLTQLIEPSKRMQVCSFLWIYYGYPSSSYEGVNVEKMRYECGKKMAQRDDAKPDVVAGVPDSGLAHAIGYANESGIPYSRPFIKYTPTWSRSFMPTIQSKRDLIARMKQLAVEDLIKDKSLLLIDDSIVRGTQMRETTEYLFESGAKEVHIRPACPPLVYGCKYLSFSRSSSEMELITRRVIERLENGNVTDEILQEYTDPDSEKYANMVEEIRKELNFTSLRYNRLDDMLDAVGIDKDKLCTYCWDGKE